MNSLLSGLGSYMFGVLTLQLHTRNRNIEEVPTHSHHFNTTFQHNEFLLKTDYIVLNFKSNVGAYGHNLLAYELDVRGCKFVPGCKIAPGTKLAPGCNLCI